LLRLIELPFAVALLLWPPIAPAQRYLGDLLNFGAKKLSPEEFREEVVQRVIVGRTAGGGNLELMYANDGRIVGRGTDPLFTGIPVSGIAGDWKVDESGKICTSMRIGNTALPPRCQFWFKYGDEYFIADSDTDRYVLVIRRTLKQ
jgi:hypothetical protein